MSASLKLTKRKGSTRWWVRGTVDGKRYEASAGTDCREQAEEFLADLKARTFRERVYGRKSVASFADAVAAHLSDAKRSKRDVLRIERLLLHFKETPLKDIDQGSLEGAYKACLRDGLSTGPGGKLRGVLAPLRAVLRTAALHKLCEAPMLKAPKTAPAPTYFLKPEEVARLILAAPEHIRPLFIFLFATGARASEAIGLDWADVDLKGRRARLRQKQKMARPIRDADLPPVAVAALRSLPHRSGAVFRPDKRGEKAPPPGAWQGYKITRDTGDASDGEGGQFKKVWATACREAGLPGEWRIWTDKQGKERRQWVPEHTPHDARHTWATWHYCIRKDLLRLKADGGWSTITMVERYAKVMPDAYRDEAIAWLEGRAAMLCAAE
jgi:integrase